MIRRADLDVVCARQLQWSVEDAQHFYSEHQGAWYREIYVVFCQFDKYVSCIVFYLF